MIWYIYIYILCYELSYAAHYWNIMNRPKRQVSHKYREAIARTNSALGCANYCQHLFDHSVHCMVNINTLPLSAASTWLQSAWLSEPIGSPLNLASASALSRTFPVRERRMSLQRMERERDSALQQQAAADRGPGTHGPDIGTHAPSRLFRRCISVRSRRDC